MKKDKTMQIRNIRLRRWWYWLNNHDRDVNGRRKTHELTIFPYFRCESGKIDSKLDPDNNPKSECEEFSTTKDGNVISLEPGQGDIWTCKTCYDIIQKQKEEGKCSCRVA